MIFQQATDMLAHRKELDPISNAVQGVIRAAYRAAGPAGRPVKNALYGTWFGHPLHPSLTDLAIGAWATASVLDVLDSVTRYGALSRCADGALAFGTMAGMAAMASGLTDAQHIPDPPRRIGVLHGIMNVGLVFLQAASLTQRARGRRGTGRVMSLLGLGGLLVSSYLGGELVERYRIGVNRAPQDGIPMAFQPVMALADLPENQPRQVQVSGVPVVLVRQGDRIYAMHATCTHMSGNLAQGMLVDGAIQCPLHGSRFALDDGHVVDGPASFAERCLATRVRNGQIEVGPGEGLGRCQHEPVSVQAPEAQEMVGAGVPR